MGRRPILPPIRGALAGGKKVTIDFEKAEPHLTPYHNWTREELLNSLRRLRQELMDAEARDLYNKAKKIRREINAVMEAELALPRTWCPTCLNVLHRCRCPKDPTVSRSTNYRRRKKEEWAQAYLAESRAIREAERVRQQEEERLEKKEAEKAERRQARLMRMGRI